MPLDHFAPDVTGVLLDPDLGAQPFTIIRIEGKWVRGSVVTHEARIPAYGNIQPATDKQLQQVPEGDRASGVIVIRTTQEIFLASDSRGSAADDDDDSVRMSDEVEWNGERYKTLRVKPWNDYGFCVAFLTRK